MKTVVVSGANIFNGGKLEIMRTVLLELASCQDVKIIAYVNDKKLLNVENDNITFIEIPKERKSYFYRFYFEYCFYMKESERVKPDIWIALNDFTPRVKSKEQYSYYNNVLPFYKWSISDLEYCKHEIFIGVVFRFIYGINIINTKVIVQQEWIGDTIHRMYHVNKNNILVLPPQAHYDCGQIKCNTDCIIRFIYPVFPRGYKNFEVIINAVDKLRNSGMEGFKVIYTFNGSENSYGKHIRKLCQKHEDYYEFIGMVNHEELDKIYTKSHCLIFTSKVESWGLPLTEAASRGLCIICSDLPYAHETLREYKNIEFIKYDDSDALCSCMRNVIIGKCRCAEYKKEICKNDVYNTVTGWEQLVYSK